MHQFTASLHSKTHTWGACVCLAVTCHLHFWQNDQDHLHANAILLTDFVNVFLLLLLLLVMVVVWGLMSSVVGLAYSVVGGGYRFYI